MHSFVVVSRKPGRAIPEAIRARLTAADCGELAFSPAEHLHWADESESLMFGGWQAAVDVFGAGSHWCVEGDVLTAFSGYVWPKGTGWNQGGTWASQLARYWSEESPAKYRRQLDGLYAALKLTAGGGGQIITDHLSLALLYQTETPDVVVFSNRATLAAWAASGVVDRDVIGMGWLLVAGYIIGDRTGVSGVRVVPAGTVVEFDNRTGARLRCAGSTPWWPEPELQALSDEERIDLVVEDIRSSLRVMVGLPARGHLADITGGKDSRLVLAMLALEGLADRIEFRTIGAQHTPDVRVAVEIASALGLTHQVVTPAAPSTEMEERMLTHVFHTSGMFGLWDMKGALGVSRDITLTGLCGETLGTHYGAAPMMSSGAELRAWIRRSARPDAMGLLFPDVRQRYLDEIDQTLAAEPVGGTHPHDRLDEFYIRQRLRRWFGTGEELSTASRMSPLYSLLGVQVAFSLGPAARRSGRIHFEAIRRASEVLSKMPFAGDRWPEAVYETLPDGAAYRAIEPRTRTGTAPVQWQMTRLEANRHLLRQYLLEDSNNPLFEIVDRSALRNVVEAPALPTESLQAMVQLYGALTASIWLGRSELSRRISP